MVFTEQFCLKNREFAWEINQEKQEDTTNAQNLRCSAMCLRPRELSSRTSLIHNLSHQKPGLFESIGKNLILFEYKFYLDSKSIWIQFIGLLKS